MFTDIVTVNREGERKLRRKREGEHRGEREREH